MKYNHSRSQTHTPLILNHQMHLQHCKLFSQLTNSFRCLFTHPKFTATNSLKYPPSHHAQSRAFKLITILTHSSTHSFTHLYLLHSVAVTSCCRVTAIDGQAEVALHLCVVTRSYKSCNNVSKFRVYKFSRFGPCSNNFHVLDHFHVLDPFLIFRWLFWFFRFWAHTKQPVVPSTLRFLLIMLFTDEYLIELTNTLAKLIVNSSFGISVTQLEVFGDMSILSFLRGSSWNTVTLALT